MQLSRAQHSLQLFTFILCIGLALANPFAFPAGSSVSCHSSEQECQSSSGEAFCCSNKYSCGKLKNQCFDDAVVVTASASNVVTVKSTSTAAMATPTAAQSSQTASATTTTTATPTPSSSKNEVGEKMKKFFTPTMIAIVAASVVGGIILIAAISFCCWRKRKHGRALRAAYEDPDRVPYTNPVLRETSSIRGSGSAAARQSAESKNSYDEDAFYNNGGFAKEVGPLGNSSDSRPTTPSVFGNAYGRQIPPHLQQPNGYPMQQIQNRSAGPAEHQEWLNHIPNTAQRNQEPHHDRWAPVVHSGQDSFVQKPQAAQNP
ncbi:hypothetical protein EDC01DRAFT_275546 [Geopyxis carbonaria]|nr:hypothetical protein EDC01DRAFT_275546 [Geopyxis carbonaria]